MGISHSVVTSLWLILKQCGLKIATKTLEEFVREIDRVAPWYACSGSLTVASWDKLKGDGVPSLQQESFPAENTLPTETKESATLPGLLIEANRVT